MKKFAPCVLVLLLALPGVAQAKNAKQTVDEAVAKGKKGVQALVDSKPTPDVAAELLGRSEQVETALVGPTPLGVPDPLATTASKRKGPKARMATVCGGPVSRRITVAAVGVTLAWRQVR